MQALLLRLLLICGPVSVLAATEPRLVVDFAPLGSERLAVPSPGDQVRATRSDSGGMTVDIAPGPLTYPGVSFSFAHDTLSLSDCGYIDLALTNTGERILSINLRVDSFPAGDMPAGRATGTAYLKPGESGHARAYFAQPTRGYAPVSPDHIKQIFIFTGKVPDAPLSFHIDSLTAGGEPGDLTSR